MILLDEYQNLPDKYKPDDDFEPEELILIVHHPGQASWDYYTDYMEPEDATFGRDLNWVLAELQWYDKKLTEANNKI